MEKKKKRRKEKSENLKKKAKRRGRGEDRTAAVDESRCERRGIGLVVDSDLLTGYTVVFYGGGRKRDDRGREDGDARNAFEGMQHTTLG